ncbi:NAD(P)H-binding protein [Alphaproteobacteria bacterium GH1-50]|uniref:Divinyl chlorophyllide a 8-vinyl-reductase, chloroplastic n=1 Tax=Kangsaoukella pontilimi TaxID=2691042 RepID=A0A7C9MXM7_9RHOB|nr:NAD(P)H-binding protein [Kangsaoukella pontilimi]MXQ08474.1 NAD(P)H-binding protein [Kangsaoukella pontilimi]
MTAPPLSVLLLGATGTAGRGAAIGLTEAGHRVTALVREGSDADGLPDALSIRRGAPLHLERQHAEGFDALVICLASRTGLPRDAWEIDHAATVRAIDAAKAGGIRHVVLLSAICVQRPQLEFQRAKLVAEEHLKSSGLTWSIVRPTAFFKSLSGQIARVRDGRPYLLFGDGQLTSCTPISDRDLGRYIAACLNDADKQDRILPIGGPGPALTPLEMGEELFRLTGRAPRFRRVPVRMMDTIITALSLAGRVSASARDKADFARIGRYYATESMLALDASGNYSREATPSFGEDRLFDHYRDVLEGRSSVALGDHAAFS